MNEELGIIKQLFESQGVKFKEADNQQDDQNQDNQNQDQNQQQDQNNQNQEQENPVAAEVDSGVDSADQVAENVQLNQDRAESAGTPKPMASRGESVGAQTTEPSGTLQLADGTDTGISVDSSNQADALDPNGTATISFEKGNYNDMSKIPTMISEKSTLISKTVLPLIQVALIELLGNNKEYIPETFNSTFTMENNNPIFNVETAFRVDKWIGNDIQQSAIAADAKYVLDRINVVQGVTFTKAAIDCNEGKMFINFTL